jgi:signal transduction histidine kinase
MKERVPARPQPVRRELRALIGALVVFVAVLTVTLVALAISLLRLDSLASTADLLSSQIAGTVSSSGPTLPQRLEVMREGRDIARIEVYTGPTLVAAVGEAVEQAEVLTRPLPGGRMVIFFESTAVLGGRRATLMTAAMATVAAIAGLLLLIVYLPKFLRPVEQMLAEAGRLRQRRGADDDARYLVQTFRDAVERLQRQASEIEHLRGAAAGRSPDLAEITRTLDRSFQSGLIAIDSTGSVLSVNEPARQILRLGDRRLEAAADLGDSEFGQIVTASFEGRTAVNRREVSLGDGTTVVGCTSVPLFDDETFLGMLVLFVDVTASRAMESRLRDFENLVGLGHMSAGIAHEFRNALFTILGYLRLAQRDLPEETTAKIRSAEEEARKLARAVDLLLTFTKPLNLRSSRLRLDELTAHVMHRFEEAHPDIAFSTHMEESSIDGDGELLERALENVVRNAVEAVHEKHPDGGGRIRAEVTAGATPSVTIHDNGPGLDASQAATYLLPFQSGKAHGTGLGLPLARKIILHHGGTLSIEGEPGQGAVVRIAFFA